jgi:nicotinate-nucleotide adenylyltransferase
MNMVELACMADARFEASRLEEGKGKSYSILTIEKVLKQVGSDARLFFLIGADAFGDIETWHRWQDVVARVEFIVLSRPGYQYRVPVESRVHRLETLHMNVSSTEIRRKLAEGASVPELPDAVADYIREHRLYAREAKALP